MGHYSFFAAKLDQTKYKILECDMQLLYLPLTECENFNLRMGGYDFQYNIPDNVEVEFYILRPNDTGFEFTGIKKKFRLNSVYDPILPPWWVVMDQGVRPVF